MFAVSVPRIFKIAARASAVESLFPQVARKFFLFYNSVENSITSIGMFQKVALKEILTSPLLTAVACLHSAVCNAINNELLTKFLEGVLKLTEIFQEVTFNGVPF